MNPQQTAQLSPDLGAIVYPDCDGQPMSDNTRQFRWIVTIQGGLDALFQHDPDVFVAGDLLWYPQEGDPTIRAAPDVMVVFGRPKGDRGSYQQWREENIPPQVVFEVLSPGNRPANFAAKMLFYERHGVEECYVYDPDEGELTGFHRDHGHWKPISDMLGWVSPRLKVSFDLALGDLCLTGPDGRQFPSYVELHQQREDALRQAEAASRRADASDQRAARMAAQLRALGIDPDAVP